MLWLAVLLAGAYTIKRGFAPEVRHLDARSLYLGGACWSGGRSPYVADNLDQAWQARFGTARPSSMVFAYPPTIAALLVPIGLLPVKLGLAAIDVLNVLALLASLVLLVPALRRERAQPRSEPRFALAVLLALAVGAISGTLALGQSGFWVLAAILGLWALPLSGASLPAAVLIFACSFKPSISLPFLAYSAVTRPRAVGLAALFGVPVVAALALTSGGSLLGEWMLALRTYAMQTDNGPLFLASGQHLVALLLPHVPAPALALAAAALGAAVGWSARVSRSDRPSLDDLLLLSASVVAFSSIHGYDLVIAVPLAAAIPFVRPGMRLWYLPLVALLMRPPLAERALLKLFPHLSQGGALAAGVAGLLLTALLLRQRLREPGYQGMAGGEPTTVASA